MKWSLKKWCGERDYIMFLIGINAGLRVSYLLQIKIHDIKGKKKITIIEGKTKKPRNIYLTNIYDELNNYIDTLEGTEWLFPSPPTPAIALPPLIPRRSSTLELPARPFHFIQFNSFYSSSIN